MLHFPFMYFLCFLLIGDFYGASAKLNKNFHPRFKRQQQNGVLNNANPNLNGNADFNTQNGLTVPLFQKLLGGDFLGNKFGTNVDLTNPSVSANRGFDAFNVFNTNEGINRVGSRGQGNYGGGFGRSASILGGRFGGGDNTDVNVGKNNGLDINRQRGIQGILTENTNINSNPGGGNLFGASRNTCVGEMFVKGLCFQKQTGIGLGK